jgi:hypothetical protein
MNRELRSQGLLQLPQPRMSVRARRRAIVHPALHRAQRPNPGVQANPLEQPNETQKIPPRTGAPAQIQLAAFHPMPVPRDGKYHRVDAKILEPDQFALPQRLRELIVGKFGCLDKRRGFGRQCQARNSQEQGQEAHHIVAVLRSR